MGRRRRRRRRRRRGRRRRRRRRRRRSRTKNHLFSFKSSGSTVPAFNRHFTLLPS
jgi:hypothetical protein